MSNTKHETTEAIKRAWADQHGNILAEIIPPVPKTYRRGFEAGLAYVAAKDGEKVQGFWRR